MTVREFIDQKSNSWLPRSIVFNWRSRGRRMCQLVYFLVPDSQQLNSHLSYTATSATSNHQAYIGLITGVLAMVVLLLACTVVLMVRRGRKKVALLHKHTALVSSSTKPGVTINMKDLKMNMALSTPIINNGLSRSRVAAAKSKVRRPQCHKLK